MKFLVLLRTKIAAADVAPAAATAGVGRRYGTIGIPFGLPARTLHSRALTLEIEPLLFDSQALQNLYVSQELNLACGTQGSSTIMS